MNGLFDGSELEKSYKKSYFRGKNRFSRTIDRAVFCIAAAFALFIAARAFRVRLNAAIFIGASTAFALLLASELITSSRLKAHAQATRKRVRGELLSDRLMMLNEARLDALLKELNDESGGTVFIMPRKCGAVDEDDVYAAARELSHSPAPLPARMVFITLGGASEKARRRAELLEPFKVEFAEAAELEKLSELFPISEKEIDEAIIREEKGKKPKRFKLSAEAVVAGAGKYAALGAALFIASFFLRYSSYLRALSAVCFTLAVRIHTFRRMRRLEKAADGRAE